LESVELLDYYRRRVAQYEAIYARPERQSDLAVLRKRVPTAMQGARVLEIACGTGYWTALIAEAAASVTATDLAEEPMRIAQAKPLPEGKVRFSLADAYAIDESLGRFDAAFAGFWWSHVPRARIGAFLASLHARLEPGARVVMLDNRYVDGSSTPIVELDRDGNSYQLRRLGEGSEVRVLKNFPSEDELRASIQVQGLRYEALQYYWMVDYRPT
jgi:2-polyprenyl-3-methyl-5-hydroxy-6-metoxy-1,4-benzoquinol methylase